MKPMHKKLFRDLLNFKVRGLLVILLVTISVALFGSLVLLKDNIYSARDNTYRTSNYEDVAVRTLNLIPNQNISQNLVHVDSNIKAFATRLTVPISVTTEGTTFNGVIHGINSTALPKVNSFQIIEGHFLQSPTDVLVESHFAKAQNIIPGDKLTVVVGNQSLSVTVSGVVFSPEYKYVINPKTGLPQAKSYCALWADLNSVQEVIHSGNSINEIFFILKDKSRINDFVTTISSFMKTTYQTTFSVTKGSQELDSLAMQGDVNVLVDFSLAFSGILLIIVGYTLFETLSKVIKNQKTIIGVMRSLGASKKDVSIHYIEFSFSLIFSGIVTGLFSAYFLSSWFSEQYINLVGFVDFQTVFKLSSFYEIIVMVLAVGLVSTLLAVNKITSITPRDALSSFEEEHVFSSSKFITKLSNIISKKNSYSTRIPIRNIFSGKKRTFYTSLAIALSLLLVLTSNGSLNSSFHQIDYYFGHNIKYDLEVQLDHPKDLNTYRQSIISQPGVKDAYGFVKLPTVINSSSGSKQTFFSAYSSNTTIRSYTFEQGSLKSGEIILGAKLASELQVKIGDNVTLQTVISSGTSPIEKTFEVSGIINELFNEEAHLTLETAQQFLNIGQNVTTLAITVNSHSSIQNIKNSLLKNNIGISYIQDMQQTKTSFRDLLEGMIEIVSSINLIGLVILIIFSLNTIVMDILEREREFINLRVGGANILKISKIIVLQILMTALLAIIFIFPLAQFTTSYMNQTVVSKFMAVSTYIDLSTYIIGIGVLIVGLGFGIIVVVRQIFQIKLLSATRIRFQN